MTEKIIVRKARNSDLDVLNDLSVQLGYPASKEETKNRFSLLSKENNHLLLVAEVEGNEVVGWIHVLLRILLMAEPMAEIGGLVVDEKHRGKGIGRLLVVEAEKWAKSRGIPRLVVRSNVVRREAHDFYPHVGFTHTKTSHVYTKKIF